MWEHDRRHRKGEYVFNMTKVGYDEWDEDLMISIAVLSTRNLMAICQKLKWMYWINEYVYDVDPRIPRVSRKQEPELIWSKDWAVPSWNVRAPGDVSSGH